MTMRTFTLTVAPRGADPVVVLGEPYGPFLAVTPVIGGAEDTGWCFTGAWTVTHVPTGRKIRPDLHRCLHHARQAALLLEFCGVDWSADPYGLLTDPPARAAVAVAVGMGADCQLQTCPAADRLASILEGRP
jgi:hypothetical protein